MASILDYLDWFQNIPFKQVPLNEVDILALTQFTYLDLEQVVPSCDTKRKTTIKDASRSFFEIHNKNELYQSVGFINPLTCFIIHKMANSKRFEDCKIYALDAKYDPEAHEQFMAFTIETPAHDTIVLFRGTDETVSGWREDFMMSFEETLAQKDALHYLEKLLKRTRGKVHVAGHSKGGNLALYAAANTTKRLQKRVSDIWCMDSPGFASELPTAHKIKTLKNNMHFFVPQFSIVGQLMNQAMKPTVIEAKSFGLYQHDILNWQVMGTEMVRSELDSNAKDIASVLNDTIANNSLKRREEIVNNFFDVITSSGMKSIDDISKINKDGILKVKDALKNLPEEDVQLVKQLIKKIVLCTIQNVSSNISDFATSIPKPKEKQVSLSVEDYKRWKLKKPLYVIHSAVKSFLTDKKKKKR